MHSGDNWKMSQIIGSRRGKLEGNELGSIVLWILFLIAIGLGIYYIVNRLTS